LCLQTDGRHLIVAAALLISVNEVSRR
jgi:hypothetical protein